MENSILTIFTPTYNRAQLLPRLFESLQNQSCVEFTWMVIDDGSTDNTRGVIEGFKKCAKFTIDYIYKENGGKHSAINLMLDIVTSDIVAIVDSDDYLNVAAVDIIIKDYIHIQTNDCFVNICEMLYLRQGVNGVVIGEKFVEDGVLINPVYNLANARIKGDKFCVIFTRFFAHYRFPIFKNEKFMGEAVLWNKVYCSSPQPYVFVRNVSLYFCEYLEGGLTKQGRVMRVHQPLGGIEYAKILTHKKMPIWSKIKGNILLVCYSIFAQKSLLQTFNACNSKWLFILSVPVGIILYIKWKKL